MKNHDAVLSIIILTYNRKSYLKTSIQDLLDQNVSSHLYNIMIIDDGSSDGTNDFIMEIMKSNNNVHYHWQKTKVFLAQEIKGFL